VCQRSQISFPVELPLRTTPLGLRLCALPVREIRNLRLTARGKAIRYGVADSQLRCGRFTIKLPGRLGLRVAVNNCSIDRVALKRLRVHELKSIWKPR